MHINSLVLNNMRVGDMLLRDYSDEYWHAITIEISGDDVITEAESTPTIKPVDHQGRYKKTTWQTLNRYTRMLKEGGTSLR